MSVPGFTLLEPESYQEASRLISEHETIPIAGGNANMVDGAVRMGAYKKEQLGVNRPHPLLSGMRTPVEGFYLCGSSCQGGGLNGAPGYNAAGVIAVDMGLDKWWNPLSAPELAGAAG